MESNDVLKLETLRSFIANYHDISISRKATLTEKLYSKKNNMISRINNKLKRCIENERILYRKWKDTSKPEFFNRLMKYNESLKKYNEEGNDLIIQINAARNFQQLNRIEEDIYNPFMKILSKYCASEPQHMINETLKL